MSLADLEAKVEQGHLFAVLDACDADWVPQFVDGMGEAHAVSLYRGEPEELYWAIAPYLVLLDQAGLAWITKHALDDEAWGMFIVADISFVDLRRHLRGFLRVLAPGGETLYFRFYDPRVLPAFLASCTRDEITRFYGPINDFVITDASAGNFQQLSREAGNARAGDERPRISIRRRR
ncbi:MAG TPA: DUF4123 domain-containing protein [Longimicrobiaceae bacterium]|nr:DUF4123 domain-containing protein [Longimicrobiaceae bacterium]